MKPVVAVPGALLIAIAAALVCGCSPVNDAGPRAAEPALAVPHVSASSVPHDPSMEDVDLGEPLDLTGTWVQVNSHSADGHQEAIISDSSIEVYWVHRGGDRALYWAGDYVPPDGAADAFSWRSVRDTSKTVDESLASTEAMKLFAYAGTAGTLVYEVTADGVARNVELQRQQ